MRNPARVIVIGSGIGGLTTAALLAQAGYAVTVLEAQTYPGGSASTWTHKGYRFESGATVAGGFQPGGPHQIVGEKLGIDWPVRLHDPAWAVHLPDRSVELTADNADVLEKFPATARFWETQAHIADMGWKLSAQGLPWPPRSSAEFIKLAKIALGNFPQDLQLLPFVFNSVYDWLKRSGVSSDPAFVRFLDGQLLISAQTTTRNVNAMYGATALDLARQGVYHVEGGIGGLAEALVNKIEELGGEVLYRQRVTRIAVENGQARGVYATQGRRSKSEMFFPADAIIANLTPWDADKLLGENSPASLRREVQGREGTWGAFVLHLGLKDGAIPQGFPDHHQILTEMEGPLGEGRSIFISLSPEWDTSRAPSGRRAATITTHTDPAQWWSLLERDEDAYYAQKEVYTERLLNAVERIIPGFKAHLELILPGTPVTYQFYTSRHRGMVGGFPQTSLFKMRGPRTGIANMRLVGDSIFPGQSTAGVTLGAMRVADDIQRHVPRYTHRVHKSTEIEEPKQDLEPVP